MNVRITQASIALCLMFSVLMMTACPKDSAVRRAAKESYNLAGLTHDVIVGVDRAYNDHILSKGQKDKLALWLETISHGGAKFNQIATQVNSVNANVVTADKLNLLNTILSQEIAGPFLQILEELRALTPGQAAYLTVAIAALRTAILTISAAVSMETYQKLLRSDLTYA